MTERVILGRHPDTGEVGLWISRPGASARYSTSLDDFLVHPLNVNQRPYARIQPVQLVRGDYIRTTIFADGSKGDTYTWTAHYFHNFGYIPIVLVQLGAQDTGNDIWIDGARINIQPLQAIPYRYAATDPSKSPISGSYYFSNPLTWTYQSGTDTMVWQGSTAMTTYTIYRDYIA